MKRKVKELLEWQEKYRTRSTEVKELSEHNKELAMKLTESSKEEKQAIDGMKKFESEDMDYKKKDAKDHAQLLEKEKEIAKLKARIAELEAKEATSGKSALKK